jgi:protein TonB
MSNRFLTHFSTVFFIHAALIFGGITMLHHEAVTGNLGQRILNLKVASEVLLSSPAPARMTQTKTKNVPAEAAPATSEVKPGEIPEVTSNALSGQAIADMKTIYKAQLRSRIEENKFYPMAARRMGQTGTVIIAFTLLEDGSIIDVRIDSSSGNSRLDSAGLEAVKKVGKFKAIPSEFNASTLDMSVPIKFSTL